MIFKEALSKIENDIDLPKIKQEVSINVVNALFNGLLKRTEAVKMLADISRCKKAPDLLRLAKNYSDIDNALADIQITEDWIAINAWIVLYEDLNDNLRITNWQERLGILLHNLNEMFVYDYHRLLIRAYLAQMLRRIWHLLQKRGTPAADFQVLLLEFFEEIHDTLPNYLFDSSDVRLNKRQPSFMESVKATLDRLLKIDIIKEALKNVVDGIIVGGSMSYGPFFNVRSALDNTGSSDIDMMVIVDNDNIVLLADKLEAAGLFAKDEMANFKTRIMHAIELVKQGKIDIFSHKFNIPGADYDISIHFMTYPMFKLMLTVPESNEDTVVTLKDYKARPFPHKACVQQNFYGQKYKYIVPEQEPIEDGVIVKLPAYIIDNGKFHPGIYHNIISPRFEVSLDKEGKIMPIVEDFKKGVKQRLKREGGDGGTLSRSHMRNAIFSPLAREEIDEH